MIPNIVGGLLVLAALVAIIVFMVRGPVRGGPADDLSKVPGMSAYGAFVNGALSAIALGTALAGVSDDWLAGATCGACVGILYGMLSGTGPAQKAAIQVLSGLFGVLGLAFLATKVFGAGPAACSVVPVWEHAVSLAVLILALGVGILAAGLRGILHLKFSSALAAFGVFKVLTFLATPLGISVLELPWPGWVIAFATAAVLGFAAGVAPDFVVGVSAAAVTVIAFVVPATFGNTCSAAPNLANIPPVLGFVVAYWLAHLLIGHLIGRPA